MAALEIIEAAAVAATHQEQRTGIVSIARLVPALGAVDTGFSGSTIPEILAEMKRFKAEVIARL